MRINNLKSILGAVVFDIMKKFHVNYNVSGTAIDQLLFNGWISKEEHLESNSITSMYNKHP